MLQFRTSDPGWSKWEVSELLRPREHRERHEYHTADEPPKAEWKRPPKAV